MMRIIGRVLLAAATILSGAAGASVPMRHALVIGNDSYPGNNLQNARNDARSVAGSLGAMGYVTTLVLDVDHRTLEASIDRFAESLTAGDVALVYYAGHGLQVNGENYLVPTDFHVTDQTDVTYQGYGLSKILGKLTERRASTQIVILDACRDNPFLASRSLKGGWAPTASSAGTFLAFGTSPGSTASDDPRDDHGLFTKSLLRFLPSNLDVERLFQQVRQDVIARSNGHQVPWTSSSLIGSLHLDPRQDEQAPKLQIALSEGQVPGDPRSRSLGTDPVIQVSGDTANKGRESALLAQGLQSARGLDFPTAIKAFESVLLLDPQCSIALRVLGVLYHLTGRGAEAQQVLSRAIAINNNDRLAYSYRCLVSLDVDTEAAEADCRKAIAIRDDASEPHIGLALDLAKSRRFKKAYDEASRAVKLAPNSPLGLTVRGELERQQQHDAIAQQDFSRATALSLNTIR